MKIKLRVRLTEDATRWPSIVRLTQECQDDTDCEADTDCETNTDGQADTDYETNTDC